MRLLLTLSLYIGRRFLLTVLATIAVMLVIVGLMELLELVRRAGDATHGISFATLFQMTLLKLPTTAEKIYPFAFMIGSMITLARLTRSSELVVARAAGVSVWQFLLPGVAMALALGALIVAVMNPVAAYTITRFDRMEGKYITGKASVFSVSPSGLWMRQSGSEAIHFQQAVAYEYIIHAVRMDQSNYTLESVMILLFDAAHRFVGRIDAPRARLLKGEWRVTEAALSTPQAPPTHVPEFRMPTQLTLSQIQDSFSAPETFSFWQLPAFIAVLEKAGFSALQHRLHFHSLMATPPLLAGMLLLAAVFALRPPRRGRTGMMIVIGLASGFMLYFMTNIIYALGASGDLPIVLAAWAPSLIVLMVASAALLHLEDG
ncbi:MAG: LPS export ABC transporter permease LptG [Alphaproteobacteria bacterium]|nr:LPS export ABC transporter permease LptG [Alphaproteobacteria bacterium]